MNGFKRVKSFSYRINTTTAKTSPSNKVASTISNSVLATGEWYRFYIEKSGVYKISKSFLQELGINLNATNLKDKSFWKRRKNATVVK
jgi:hypothetical protein